MKIFYFVTITFNISIIGKQGHVAYPKLADNPIPILINILNIINTKELDTGNEYFQPSNLEITSIDVGNKVSNLIPEKASATFNIRFNNEQNSKKIINWIETICQSFTENYSLSFNLTGESFITPPGKLSSIVSEVIKEEGVKILTVTENGFGKRTEVSKYRLTSRGGKGVTTLKITDKTGLIVNAFQTENEDDIVLLSSAGKATRLKTSDISIIGRATQGVRLMKVGEDIKVVAVAKITEKENE